LIEIRRILCPVDLSETSQHALRHAVAIAKWYGSRVTVFYVTGAPLLPQPPMLFANLPDGADMSDEERRQLEEHLESWLTPARDAGVQADLLFDNGSPAARIVEHAAAEAIDLIVMGTHGLSGFERLLLGSVTERVLRKAGCPVMTVPPAAAGSSRVPYARLLCPVDFSPSSLAALTFAFSLAKEADAQLTILNVLDWPADDELIVEQVDTPALRRVVEEKALARLAALVTDEARLWCTPKTEIRYGKPYRQILDVAEQEQTDLIVVGVRGRHAPDLAIFGSTTNHLVRQARCPVQTLRR